MKRIVTNEETVCDICGQPTCMPGAERLMHYDDQQFIIKIEHVPSYKVIRDICPECFDKILKGY